jgi:hypothetical protein
LVKYLKTFTAAIGILFLFTAIFTSPVMAEQGSAQTAISSAKNTIKSCYDAVKESEAAGANIDFLMVTLNDAAGLLSKAELAYASNDYNSAFDYASKSKNKLNNFIPQANALKEDAIKNNNQNFITIVLSLVVSAAILCVGIAAWVVLNRKERRNLNGSPTV